MLGPTPRARVLRQHIPSLLLPSAYSLRACIRKQVQNQALDALDNNSSGSSNSGSGGGGSGGSSGGSRSGSGGSRGRTPPQSASEKSRINEADLREAIRLADSTGDTGTAWGNKVTLGKALFNSGRSADATRVLEEYVSTVEESISKGGVEPGGTVTGGRERDPYKMGRVVDGQFCLAFLHLSAGVAGSVMGSSGGPRNKSATNRGREHYTSACAKEARLPGWVLNHQNGQFKEFCQMILATLPLSATTQQTISAGVLGGQRGVLECHGCGGVNHGGLKMCGGCKKAAYCSTECQKRAWKTHKAVCKK